MQQDTAINVHRYSRQMPLFLSDFNCERSVHPTYVLCPCLSQPSRWDFSRIRVEFIYSDNFFLLVTSEFLFYYHCNYVYGVQLTILGIIWYIYQSLSLFVYWSDHNCTLSDTRSPLLLMMNHAHILITTTHCGIHLTYEPGLPPSYTGTFHHG